MGPKIFCQSCTMPIDNLADRGTEKDGSLNNEYCKYCYHDGKLINPDMTLDQMKSLVITQMNKMNLPQGIIQKSVEALPNLKRWKKAAISVNS